MTLEQLQYLVMLAHAPSICQAAEKLFISQPALSHSIKKLEDDLNITLLTRTTKGMTLTPAGMELAHLADHILATVDKIKLAALTYHINDTYQLESPLKLFSTLGVSALTLSKAAEQFQFIYPDISLQCYAENLFDVIHDLTQGKCDLGLLAVDSEEYWQGQGLTSELITLDNLYALIPQTLSLARCQTVALSQVAAYPVCLFSYHDDFYALNHYGATAWDKYLSAGQQLNIIFKTSQADGLMQFMEQHTAVAIFTESTLKNMSWPRHSAIPLK